MKPVDLSRDNSITRKAVALAEHISFVIIDNAESNTCLEILCVIDSHFFDNILHT